LFDKKNIAAISLKVYKHLFSNIIFWTLNRPE